MSNFNSAKNFNIHLRTSTNHALQVDKSEAITPANLKMGEDHRLQGLSKRQAFQGTVTSQRPRASLFSLSKNKQIKTANAGSEHTEVGNTSGHRGTPRMENHTIAQEYLSSWSTSGAENALSNSNYSMPNNTGFGDCGQYAAGTTSFYTVTPINLTGESVNTNTMGVPSPIAINPLAPVAINPTTGESTNLEYVRPSHFPSQLSFSGEQFAQQAIPPNAQGIAFTCLSSNDGTLHLNPDTQPFHYAKIEHDGNGNIAITHTDGNTHDSQHGASLMEMQLDSNNALSTPLQQLALVAPQPLANTSAFVEYCQNSYGLGLYSFCSFNKNSSSQE